MRKELAYLNGKRLLCGDYTQYTPSGKSLFVKLGRWNIEPNIGDIVYFYGNTLARVCHVGIVIDLCKNGNIYSMKTVEGNTTISGFSRNGGQVAIKEYKFSLENVGGKNRINGFGRPDFSDEVCTVEEFIEVAKNEVGYEEKESNKDLEDKHANVGDKNFTKYGAWYGENGLYWCQQFISWCAYTACKKHLESMDTMWVKDGDNWKYELNGEFIVDSWQKIEDRWYVFDNKGSMIKGWFKNIEDWYYLDKEDGAMLAGQWLKLDNKYYYLSKVGIMARNCYVKDKEKEIYYYIGENGEYDKSKDSKEVDMRRYEVVE